MDLAEYRSFDALGLSALVERGDVTADELLDTALAAIDKTNPSVNAVVNLFADQARAAIASGLPAGPFRGVPFVLKDLVADVGGVVTSNGSRLFADAVAAADSEIVRRYRRAGLVLFAKTNCAEMGTSASTEPILFGPTRNPWDLGLTAGGSSGGAAAAVAGGIVPMAHATDGGGSIRIPASCCGVFGLKPTRARITAGPRSSEGWGGMGTQHVVSRSVRDSAAALDATCGAMPGDPYWAPPPSTSYLDEVGADPGRLRIGLVLEAPSGIEIDAACREAAEATGRRCEALGHDVFPVAWPFSAETLALAKASVVPAQTAVAVATRLAELGRSLRPDDLEAVTAMVVEWGVTGKSTDYVASVHAGHLIGRTMGQLFEGVDALLSPTLGCRPFPLGTLDTSNPAQFLAEVAPVTAFTAVANISGQPAMSLPLDHPAGTGPIGSMIVGRFGDEATLFRLAGQLERAHPWFSRLPPW